MKHFIFLLCIVLLCNCTHSPSTTRASTEATDVGAYKGQVQPLESHKLNSYLSSSKKINGSDVVNELVQKIVSEPSNPDPLYILGYLHMQSGLDSKSNAELDLAETYLLETLKIAPGNQVVIRALYNIYYEYTVQNQSPTAIFDAQRAFNQLPAHVRMSINPPSLAKYVVTFKQQEKDHQRNHQALRDLLLQAKIESPFNDLIYIQLANLYSQDRYFSLALATLKLGAEGITTSANLYKAIGDTYNKRAEVHGCNYENADDIRNAAKYYQLAIPLKANDQDLHYDLSHSFFDQDLNQIALHEASIALEIDESPEALSLNAQNYSNLGDHQKANLLLQKAVAKGYTMKSPSFHEIYMNQGDWQNAAKSFDTYIKLKDPTSYSVYDLIKSDIIAHQAKQLPWIVDKKITLQNDWEEALFNYWSAKTNELQLKSAAHTRCEKTEYFFYTGYRDLQMGNGAQAKMKFAETLKQNTYRFIERPLAAYFLTQ